MAKLQLKIDGTAIAYISTNLSYSMDSLAHQFNATVPSNTTNLTHANYCHSLKHYISDKHEYF